ncbi:MAG: peptidoglycan-binding domain-containing protein [Arachnia sp.]
MSTGVGKKLVLGLAVVALAGGAFWAGRVTVQPVAVPSDLPASEVIVEVTEQTVGRSLPMNVTVSQKKQALAVNALTGVITQVRPSGEVDVGDTLYTVGGVPVRAVKGSVPFYRELGYDMTGPDVQQLEDALVKLKRLSTADGYYGTATTAAVRQWQKDLGLPRTGRIALGELVAIPTLPSSIVMDTEIASPGLVLSGGEKIAQGTVGEPSFILKLSQGQARLVPESAVLTMTYQGHDWEAIIVGAESTDTGDTIFHLSAPTGGIVCGKECDVVAADKDIYILSKVEVVPPATGPAVPVAAITTKADGSASILVVDASGTRTPRTVEVIASQDGVAIVKGVDPGDRVQVLAGAGVPAPSPSPSK